MNLSSQFSSYPVHCKRIGSPLRGCRDNSRPDGGYYSPGTNRKGAGACSSSPGEVGAGNKFVITSFRPFLPRELGFWLLTQWLTGGHFTLHRILAGEQKAPCRQKQKPGCRQRHEPAGGQE
ncbi:MAG: hypothetical protein AB1611_16855 [bacterium]